MSPMATNMRLADSWANSVRAAVPGSGPLWLQTLRGAAAQEFLDNGLPGNKDEAWRYTSLRQLEDIQPHLGPDAFVKTCAAWLPAVVDTADFGFRVRAGRVDGIDPGAGNGVTVMHLDQALMQPSSPLLDRLRCMLEKVDIQGRGRAFEALNTAMLEHGVVVHVAAGVDAGRCFARWIQGGRGLSRLDNFRMVLILEPGAKLSLVEHFQGLEDPAQEGPSSAHALSLVVQIELSAGAVLQHVRLQSETARNVLFTSGEVVQGEGSSYEFMGFDLGGSLVRHAITCRLAGEGARTALNGAFLAKGSSHVDYHLCVDHQAPACSSEQFFRGVLGGHSRGVFNGKALIRRGADRSKVRQSNANLLLSAFAEIDSKPELEIYADEVEASHGATVGQLDEQAVFYLRSRGLDEAEARRMLTSAFCSTVTARLNDAALAAQINGMLEAAMPQQDPTGKEAQ